MNGTDKRIVEVHEGLDLGRFMKAPVSPAVLANGLVFTSGYVPLDPATGRAVEGPIEDQARQTLENLRQVLAAIRTPLRNVVKVEAYLADEADYAGFNAVYAEFFPRDFPARRTILAKLVGGFRVEIDCVAIAGRPHEGRA